MKIGFDIDGVLYPWSTAVRDIFKPRYGDIGESTHWDYVKEQISAEDWADLWVNTFTVRDMFGRNDLSFADAVRVVRDLSHAGHEIHLITHRSPERASFITASWVGAQGIRFSGLHVLENSTPKSGLINVLGIELYVDDKPEVCTDVLQNARPLVPVFMPNRPWNIGRDPDLTDVGPWFYRYDNPRDIVDYVEARTAAV